MGASTTFPLNPTLPPLHHSPAPNLSSVVPHNGLAVKEVLVEVVMVEEVVEE